MFHQCSQLYHFVCGQLCLCLTRRLILSPPSWAQVLHQELLPTISQFCQLLFCSRLPSLLTVLGSLHCLLGRPLMAAHSFPFVVLCFLQGALWQQRIDLGEKFALKTILRNNLFDIALCDHWDLDWNVHSFNLSLSNAGSFRASPTPHGWNFHHQSSRTIVFFLHALTAHSATVPCLLNEGSQKKQERWCLIAHSVHDPFLIL